MIIYLLLFTMLSRVYAATVPEGENVLTNVTGPKDMYVVRATVYQVGILTNRTNETENFNDGRQETITFYRNKGSAIDMNALPEPLATNVTAEHVLGVAPIGVNTSVPWTAIKPPLAAMQGDVTQTDSENRPKSKREVANTPAKIEKGSAVIPSEAGVQSIALPPLITLNKNFSEIPVPIPNVSVVSYAKVNTLIHSP